MFPADALFLSVLVRLPLNGSASAEPQQMSVSTNECISVKT